MSIKLEYIYCIIYDSLNQWIMSEFMKYLKLKEELIYDGSQIEPMWAFRKFQIKDSSIVSWIGPMEIEPDNLIDYEDHGLDIKGDELLHFIIEHFDCQPADIRLCYHRQRLFVMIIKDLLDEMGMKTIREGDDLYSRGSDYQKEVQENSNHQKDLRKLSQQQSKKQGKLSVSIATCSNSSMKIHFALNLTNKGTPSDVETACLTDCLESIERDDIFIFSDKACEKYINEISLIEGDITKTKVF